MTKEEKDKENKEKEEAIIKNWSTFKSQVMKLTDKSSKVEEFLDAIQEEMMVSPASTRTDLVCSYAGGLVEHSLRVLTFAAKLMKVYGYEKEIQASSLRLVTLLHDLGKIGDETKVYYTDQTDEWRRNKLGQNYEINERFSAIPVSQISLRWLSKFGFNLELEEWYSISSIREHNKDESTPIKGEPVLAVILQQAVKMACIQGKNKKQVSVVSG